MWLSLVTVILCSLTYLFSEVLAPFVISFVLAYFFAPFVSWMETLKIKRDIGALIALTIIALVLVLVSVTILPLLYLQFVEIIHIAMNHKDDLHILITKISENETIKKLDLTSNIKEGLEKFSSELLSFFRVILEKVIHSGFVAVNTISLILIVPLAFYYFLADWPKLVNALYSCVPPKLLTKVKSLMLDIHTTMSGYIRGQTLVCLIMAMFYSIGFTIIGLNSGFALGLFCGIVTFIPFVGAIFAFLVSSLICFIQFMSMTKLVILVILFAVAQFIEGHFLVPNLVGKRVNLHPVWIIFGLMAGANLFGFIGVLIALPLTAFISVLVKFTLNEYRNSKLFR